MSKRQLSFLTAVPLLACNGVLNASTLSSVSAQIAPFLSGSASYGSATGDCSQSNSTSAGCVVEIYAPIFGQAFAIAEASSAFGSLSGDAGADIGTNLLGEVYPGTAQIQFISEFSDPVLITGGAGRGTLVVHFSWNACSSTRVGNEFIAGSWPSFSVMAGTTMGGWTGGGTSTAGCALGVSGSGTRDLSTEFAFGGYVTVGGSTAGQVISNWYDNQGPDFVGAQNGSSASLTVTGFSVYDAAGNLVPGAEVTPLLAPLLIPEPTSISLLVCGALALCGARLVIRCRPARPTGC